MFEACAVTLAAVPDSSEYSEILLQYSTKLMEFFNFRCPTMLVPMLCILKYAGGNLEEAMKSIVQALIVFCPKISTWDTIQNETLSFIVNLMPA